MPVQKKNLETYWRHHVCLCLVKLEKKVTISLIWNSSHLLSMARFLLKHMYSILSPFTWRPMPPAACSKWCSRGSAWVGVFARSSVSTSSSASVIVFAGYRLFLAFSSVKPFSFIRSIEVWSTYLPSLLLLFIYVHF